MCPDSLMTRCSFPSIQSTSSQGCAQWSALSRNCVFLCANEGLPVNFWSSGSSTPCSKLAKKEMVCMLVWFPREVTMQGSGVPKAVQRSQEERPLGAEQRVVLPAKEPLHTEQRNGSLHWLPPGKWDLAIFRLRDPSSFPSSAVCFLTIADVRLKPCSCSPRLCPICLSSLCALWADGAVSSGLNWVLVHHQSLIS